MEKKIEAIVEAIDRLKGEEILVLDFEKTNSLCDKVVICTGRSNRNSQAIADEIEEKLKELKARNGEVVFMGFSPFSAKTMKFSEIFHQESK